MGAIAGKRRTVLDPLAALIAVHTRQVQQHRKARTACDKHAAAVAISRPRMAGERVTPLVMRHSCAVALLQSGTDVTVIRDYLGHASVATTSRYLSVNLKMTRDALETFWKHAGIEPSPTTPWKPKPDLLSFLQSL